QALSRLPAVAEDQARDDLVVTDVFADAAVHPVVPLASVILGEAIFAVEPTIARVIAQAGGPPRGIGGASEQLVDFPRAFVGRRVSQKGLDFRRARQGAGHVE